MAVLTYLDFFQTGVQRVAVSTAAAMCRGISRDATDTVANAIPLLTPLLQYKVSLKQKHHYSYTGWSSVLACLDVLCTMPTYC